MSLHRNPAALDRVTGDVYALSAEEFAFFCAAVAQQEARLLVYGNDKSGWTEADKDFVASIATAAEAYRLMRRTDNALAAAKEGT